MLDVCLVFDRTGPVFKAEEEGKMHDIYIFIHIKS